MAAFHRDVLNSRLFESETTDANEYAELFDSEAQRVLDAHAPLQCRIRRQGQHDIRQLSDEARQAKQLRRRLERRYRWLRSYLGDRTQYIREDGTSPL